jgi:hypothetical protein
VEATELAYRVKGQISGAPKRNLQDTHINHMKQAIGQAASTVKDKAADAAHHVQEKAAAMWDKTRSAFRKSGEPEQTAPASGAIETDTPAISHVERYARQGASGLSRAERASASLRPVMAPGR